MLECRLPSHEEGRSGDVDVVDASYCLCDPHRQYMITVTDDECLRSPGEKRAKGGLSGQ